MSLSLVPNVDGQFHGSLSDDALDSVIDKLTDGGSMLRSTLGQRLNKHYKARLDSLFKDMSTEARAEAHKHVKSALSDDVMKQIERDLGGAPRFDSEQDRLDADGVFMTRELSYRLSKLIEQEVVAASSFELFASNEAVPPGAKSFRAKRIEHFGEARIYRGSSSIPTNRTSVHEEEFKIHHLVTSVNTDIFQTMAQNFAGMNIAEREMAGAKEVLYQEADRIFWNGDASANLYGVTSYPFLARMFLAVPFSSASTGLEIVRELNRAAKHAEEDSKGKMRPTACVMSHQLYNYIAEEPLDPSGDKETVLAYWIRTNSQGIKKVTKADRLTGAGPGGENGIFFYAEGNKGPLLTMPQPFAVLPPQMTGFGSTTYMYCTLGSIYMPYVGNQTLAWVPAS